MFLQLKEGIKHLSVSLIAGCAVLVCALFVHFYMDLVMIRSLITTEAAWQMYTAQVSTIKVVCGVTGGCLLMTSVVTLFFYIKQYIDAHQSQLGLLKALGYTDIRIAGRFWVFCFSILAGTSLGLGGAYLLMPRFYQLQNAGPLLPEVEMHVHPTLPLYFVLLPTILFACLSIGYACLMLRRSPADLLRGQGREVKAGRHSGRAGARNPAREGIERSFLQDVQRYTVRRRKTLTFFICFASFCFAAMTQMSFSMRELSSTFMAGMILVIGLILALVTLLLAIATVIKGHRKTVAMMQAFGYDRRTCCRAVLGGYRPMVYLGFAVGTVYQYVLLRLMVEVVFRDIPGVPVYRFDVPVMCMSLIAFVVIYEFVMWYCAKNIGHVPIKEIMSE